MSTIKQDIYTIFVLMLTIAIPSVVDYLIVLYVSPVGFWQRSAFLVGSVIIWIVLAIITFIATIALTSKWAQDSD